MVLHNPSKGPPSLKTLSMQIDTFLFFIIGETNVSLKHPLMKEHTEARPRIMTAFL